MRFFKLAFVTGVSLLIMSACGSSNPTTPITQTATRCAAGQVYSAQYGCLAQGTCQSGFGTYANNTCVVATAGNPIPQPNTPQPNTLQTCPVGNYFVPNYGCMPQGNCAYGSVFMEGRCNVVVPSRGYYYTRTRTRGGFFVWTMHYQY
ncbi:MAG: hypothetical protein H7333_09275 [Bdellovibrionales bacterium]|nr:hypothetical protein [Oligoflexia bacterium]